MALFPSGWIEFRDPFAPVRWRAVVNAGLFLEQTWIGFEALFGVPSAGSFAAPFVPLRGFPADASRPVRRAFERDAAEDGGGYPTWALWSELKRLDWDGDVAAAPGKRLLRVLERGPALEVDRLPWREILTPGWRLVWDLMGPLGKRYGDDCVRLVVWFAG